MSGPTNRSSAEVLTVVVITYRRPEHLRRCLSSLAAQSSGLYTVLVVDQSPDSESRRVVEGFAFASWIDNRANAGNMTDSRNKGLELVRSELVSFIDDDSEPAEDWATEIVAAFRRNPGAVAVAGRIDNGPQVSPDHGGPVGLITRRGAVIGNFESRQHGDVPVHHGVGANMSFRTDALRELGGFRQDWPGTSLGEDTDVFLRLRRLGGAVYTDRALVRHTSAPHAVGQRFDLRYAFYAASNYTLLLRRNYGALSSQFWGAALGAPVRAAGEQRSWKGRLARVGVAVVGTAYGFVLCLRLDGMRRPSIVRTVQ